jgi:hypothetical protein
MTTEYYVLKNYIVKTVASVVDAMGCAKRKTT